VRIGALTKVLPKCLLYCHIWTIWCI